MSFQTRGPAPQPVLTRTSTAFRLSTGLLAALAVLMATAALPQLALPAPWQWVTALAAAGMVYMLSDVLLAIAIVALPATIFVGGMFGLLAH